MGDGGGGVTKYLPQGNLYDSDRAKFPVLSVIFFGGLEPLGWLSRSGVTIHPQGVSFIASSETHKMSGPEKIPQVFGSTPVYFT